MLSELPVVIVHMAGGRTDRCVGCFCLDLQHKYFVGGPGPKCALLGVFLTRRWCSGRRLFCSCLGDRCFLTPLHSIMCLAWCVFDRRCEVVGRRLFVSSERSV